MKVRNWKKYNNSNHELLEVNTLLEITLDNGMEDLTLQMVITHDVKSNITIGKLTTTYIIYGFEKKDEWSDITELYNFDIKECWKYLHHLVREFTHNGYGFYSFSDMDIFQYYPHKAITNRVQDIDIAIKTNKDIAFKWYMATPYEKRNYFKLELNY